jgi:hypothetical protein
MYYSYVEIEYVATSFSPARTDLALKLLKKNRGDFWATGFSCCVADSCLRAGKKINVRLFSCRLNSEIRASQPYFACRNFI